MENMTFYDFITFFIDVVGVRFLFQNSFHSFLYHRKNMTSITVYGPIDHTVAVKQSHRQLVFETRFSPVSTIVMPGLSFAIGTSFGVCGDAEIAHLA